MALKTKKDITYLNTSKEFPGKLVNKKLAESSKGQDGVYTGVEGKLVGIERKNGEYNKKPTVQYQFILEDGGKFYSVQLNGKAYLAGGIFSRLLNANLDRPIEIGAYAKDGADGEPQTVAILRQDGKTVPYREDWPKPAKVAVGDDTATDWTPVLKECDALCEQFKAKYGSWLETPAPVVSDVVGSEVADDDNIPF